MKKSVTLLLIFLLLFSFSISFISAQDTNQPDAPVSDEEINKVQQGVDVVPLDPETGELDKDKLNLGKSKAEKRIEAINNWTKENASWLKWVFGMVPEISWLFAINFLLLLTFFNGLVLHSEDVFVFLSKGVSKLVGIGVFALLIATHFFKPFVLNVLAKPATMLITTWWGQLIIVVCLIVLNPLMPIYFKHIEKTREKTKKSQEELDRERLHGEVKVAESFTKALSK